MIVSAAGSLSAEVRLPAIIGSNMVLQAERRVPIWGWADKGEKVTVTVGRQNKTAVADPLGRWRVTLEPMTASGTPVTMEVRGRNTLKLENVLIGQVWIGSGQSNMDRSIASLPDGKAKGAAATVPQMRLFQVPRVMADTPQEQGAGRWVVCTPKTVKNFSAVLYFFGRTVQRELEVPVGLIAAAWAGSRIEPWMPLEVLDSVEELKPAAAKIRAGKRADEHSQFRSATVMYNGMIHPLKPFAIAGVVWYQGEAHAWTHDGMRYFEKQKALITGWRAAWDQGPFPFYYTQLAPCYGMGPSGSLPADELPKLWEAQTACLTIPNTGMAVTTDLADVRDIHSSRKQDVGRRLALWALAKTYGKPVVCSGPLYRSMEVRDGKAYLSFDHVGTGLATRDGLDPDWFSIAEDVKPRQFVPAKAKIEGDKVVVWSPSLAAPVAVRFAWSNLAVPNLTNKEGLPASPFRTDGALWNVTREK